MMSTAPTEAEFSRIVDIAGLAEDEVRHEIAANEREREALARRFGLLALDRLTATVRLKRVRGGSVRLNADFEADVVQSCVVTLEPVPAHITENFSVTFSAEAAHEPGDELDLSPMAEDLTEPLFGGVIDIGETVAQYLALALDPYPRAPGVRFEPATYAGPEHKALEESPFSALASLRKRGQD